MYCKEITLCQPDSERGCCACCGLFNFHDISVENLTNFLNNAKIRLYRSSLNEKLENFNKFEIRDITSHICPYQGFIYESTPGCKLHPKVRAREMRGVSLFGSEICNSFLCPAHEILGDDLKEILVENIQHWYYYSIAIVDPESFMWIVDCMTSRFGVSFQDDLLKSLANELLTSALEIHSEFLNAVDGPIFFYSVSEYNLNKHDFSLFSSSKRIKVERERIIGSIDSLLVKK